MLVNLYIVTNDLNNKVYIGQTSKTLKQRWDNHINDALKRDGNTNKFHNALITLGIEHFSISLIDKFDVSIIDEKEIEYIAKYDSFKNGYNSTLGGGLGIRIPIEVREHIADLYRLGYNRSTIAKEIGCTANTVTNILTEYGILPDFESNKSIDILMYDKYFTPQKVFKSKLEAYTFLVNNENANCDKQGFYGHIKKSFKDGCVRYGHRWQLVSDLIYEDMIFRTKFDKEAYLQGKQAYKAAYSEYYIVDNVLNEIIKYNAKDQNNNIDVKKQSSRIPDMDTLSTLISKYSYEEIGRMYSVTGKAIRKWADSYDLVKSRKIDLDGVTCVELDIHFDTFKEAANFLIKNNYTNATHVGTLGYKISQAKKYNKPFKGFTWV